MSNASAQQGPVRGNVIGQYFGIFHGCTKEHYHKIIDSAPFEHCNLLILAFVGLEQVNDGYIPKFLDGRDNNFNGGRAMPGDTDIGRVMSVMEAARTKNRDLKILLSFGYCKEVALAATSPDLFATELAKIVWQYGFDGFDIDWEFVGGDRPPFSSDKFIALMKSVKTELQKVVTGDPILTICPATTEYLNADVLNWFTYVMPQSYGHEGNGTTVGEYYAILNSYDKIVYGLCGEGVLEDPYDLPDDPNDYVPEAKRNGAAGVFSWRLDTDSLQAGWKLPEDDDHWPTFGAANKMWELMNNS